MIGRTKPAGGLYIAISLLAAIDTLVATGEVASSPVPTLWGILGGLVIAHWFAFSLAAIATDTPATRWHNVKHSLAGIAGAFSVGVVVTVTAWLVPVEWESTAIILALIGYIALAAYVVARGHRSGRTRTLIIVTTVLVLALAIVGLKNFLGGP